MSSRFTRADLTDRGFEGFTRFAELPTTPVTSSGACTWCYASQATHRPFSPTVSLVDTKGLTLPWRPKLSPPALGLLPDGAVGLTQLAEKLPGLDDGGESSLLTSNLLPWRSR